MFKTFKRQYPLVFDTAVSISQYLMSVFQCEMTEEEIGFIALHIGASICSELNRKSTLRFLLRVHSIHSLQEGVEGHEEQFSHRLDFVGAK